MNKKRTPPANKKDWTFNDYQHHDPVALENMQIEDNARYMALMTAHTRPSQKYNADYRRDKGGPVGGR